MKIYVSLLSLLILSSCNVKLDSEKQKNEFIAECKSGLKESSPTVSEEIATKYCSCSADKILNEFDVIDLIKLNDPNSETYKRSMELIAPCLEELSKDQEAVLEKEEISL